MRCQRVVAVLLLVVLGWTVKPSFAGGSLDVRELRVSGGNGHVLVSGMFERAAPPRACPHARNSTGALHLLLTPPAALRANPPGGVFDPKGGSGLGAGLLSYSCKSRPSDSCYWLCDSECHVDQDVSLDFSSCVDPLGCTWAGECLVTTSIRCCTNCTYTCVSGCSECPQCEGCRAPLRCRTQRLN